MNTRRELTIELMARAQNNGLVVDVASDGAFNAEIALVGEAPGEREVTKGTPFIGGSGSFLWKVLKKHGVTRQHVYVTNVVKRQVSMSASIDDRRAVLDVELDHWIGLLKWELAQLPCLRYVLLLGNYALRALVNETGISKWRGSVLQAEINGHNVWCVCANNPAAVLREPKIEVLFRQDVSKLFDVIEGRYKPYKIEHLINPSFVDAVAHIDQMHDERKPIALDIEVISGETACIGLANHAHRGMCIAWRGLNKDTYSLDEERALRLRLQRLVGDNNTRIVAQNGSFDTYWLWYKDRMRVHRVWFDTLLAHHLLYPGLPHNLAALCSQYTYHPYYKDDGKDWKEGGDIDQFWRYNVTDVCITLACCRSLEKELNQAGLTKFFFDHVMRLQPHLVAMTVTGVLIDTELKAVIKEMMGEKVALSLRAFHDAVHVATGDEDYNPSPRSSKALGELFFNRLKLIGRGTSTSETNRFHILANPSTNPECREMLQTLNEFKKQDKFLSVYADMELDEDKRARCEFKQFGTQSAPGRLSSGKVMWGSGCVPFNGSAEALTPDGWVPVEQQPPVIAQAQFTSTGRCFLDFVPVTVWYTKAVEDEKLFTYNSRSFRGAFTADHRVALQKRQVHRGNNEIFTYTRRACELPSLTYTTVPVTGMLSGGEDVGIDTIRQVVVHSNEPLPDVTKWSYRSRLVFLEEMRNWIGPMSGMLFRYTTEHQRNAELVQTVAHITGKSAAVGLNMRSVCETYTCSVSERVIAGSDGFRWGEMQYTGDVGCPSVPSGMWLMRCNGAIHVTGNSNLQNQPRAAQPMFIADDGYVFAYFDLAQAEARVVGWEANIETWKVQFERARLEGGYDCHRALAAEMWGMAYNDVPTKDHDENGKPTKRFIAKRCFTDDHEVLTPDGWKLCENALHGEIAAYDLDGSVKWERPERWFAERVDETVYTFEGESLSQRVTGDHEMIVQNHSGTTYRMTAKELAAALEQGQYSDYGCPAYANGDARILAMYTSMRVSAEQYKGTVYCPTVSTGAIITRRNGRVSATYQCRHGLNYRMGVERLVETTGLPYADAAHAYALYHRANPELRRWWKTLTHELRQNGKLVSPMGRPLRVLGRIDEEAMKSIVAFKPQSCIGDKVTQVIYQCHEDDDWPSHARIVLNIHDALICLVREDQAKSALRIMKKHAESPIWIRGEPLIIPADCKLSVPTVWEYDDETHVLSYIPDPCGWHRWHGMKAVDIEV